MNKILDYTSHKSTDSEVDVSYEFMILPNTMNLKSIVIYGNLNGCRFIANTRVELIREFFLISIYLICFEFQFYRDIAAR